MPYKIDKVGGKYCVFKEGDSEPMKCYGRPTAAGAYLSALQHATESERMAVLSEIETVLEARGVDFADVDELRQAREARAKRYGIGVKAGGSLTPPKGYPADEAQYGDPVNLRYPCDGTRALTARQYFNHEGQREAGGYTSAEWAIVGKRIARLSGEGYAYSGGKVVPKKEAGSDNYARGQGQGVGGPRQGDGGPDQCECPECGRAFDHEPGTPCADVQCPDCNVALVPATEEASGDYQGDVFGGTGSGNWGHKGVKGYRGGSAPGGGIGSKGKSASSQARLKEKVAGMSGAELQQAFWDARSPQERAIIGDRMQAGFKDNRVARRASEIPEFRGDFPSPKDLSRGKAAVYTPAKGYGQGYEISPIMKWDGRFWSGALGRVFPVEPEFSEEESNDIPATFTHTVPFSLTDDVKRIAYGVVFSPDEEDAQGHSVSREDVEAACHRFMGRLQTATGETLDEHHDRFVTNQQARVCECWIQREPVVWQFGERVQEVKAGSWCLGVQFHDDGLWQQVLDGEIAGFSPRGRAIIERGDVDNTCTSA